MKKITTILLLSLVAFVFNNCSEEVDGTADLNYVSFEVNTPKLIVEQGSSADMDIKLYSTQVAGSDRTFSVEVLQDATTANPESYSVPGTVTIPANSNEGTLTISASDENLGQDPVTLGLEVVGDGNFYKGNTASLTIQKHCTLDINDFVGTFSGETEGDWGPTQVETSLDADGNLQITGVGVSFLTGYWGEEITSMETLPVNVDMETGDFTIAQAPYITTTYNGEVQPTYYLEGRGNLNACSGTMYLYYDFFQEGFGSYVDYFEDQIYFTEIISIQ